MSDPAGAGDGRSDPGRHDEDPHEVEALIRRRRAANPRHSPGRDPVGTANTRRLLLVTAVVVLLATLVLVAVVLLGG